MGVEIAVHFNCYFRISLLTSDSSVLLSRPHIQVCLPECRKRPNVCRLSKQRVYSLDRHPDAHKQWLREELEC